MANYKKSFSFRHGVQVDDDNFVVNTNGLIGIGTNNPVNNLDLRGGATISGIITALGYVSSGISTFQDDVKIGTGITFDASTNTIIAPNIQIGTSPSINNVVGYSTIGWITNTLATGLSTSLKVGIGTTSTTEYSLLIDGDPSGTGIGFVDGNIDASGIITASSFSGTVDVDDLSGVIGDDHLPNLITSNINITSGISTFNQVGLTTLTVSGPLTVTGALTGTASTAQSLTGAPDINVGVTTATRVKATNIGLGTDNPVHEIQVGNLPANGYSVDNNITVITEGKIGIGTTDPSDSLEIYNVGNVDVTVTSGLNNAAVLSLGSTTLSKGELKYDSSSDVLSLKNFSGKDIQFDVTTNGGNSGGFVYKTDNSRVFGVTNTGKVSINKSSDPADGHSLEVIGSAKVGGGSSVMGSLTIGAGTVNEFEITGSNTYFPIDPNQNLHSVSGITTLKDLNLVHPSASGDDIIPGININGLGVGATIGIATTSTLFRVDSASIGVICDFGSDISVSGAATITGGLNIGGDVSFSDSATVTGISSIDTSVGVGTVGAVGVGTTTSIVFTVPSWAKKVRMHVADLSTGSGEAPFKFRANERTNNYFGISVTTFVGAGNSGGLIGNSLWGIDNGCPLFSSFETGNVFGKNYTANGYVDFDLFDDQQDPQRWMINGQIALIDETDDANNGVVNLGGYVTLDSLETLTSVSVHGAPSLEAGTGFTTSYVNVTYRR